MTDTTTTDRTDAVGPTGTVQVFRVYIKATPEAIWEAITSPEWNGRFGYRSISEYELRPGGAFRASPTDQMREMGAPDVVVDGEVIECDPPRRLVQTWKMHFGPELEAEPYTTLTYEIDPESDHLTRVTVTHDVTSAPIHQSQITPSAGKLVENGGGWSFVLSDLKTLLESGAALEV
jgi:uncharacterized protein YndB with AHSA1/START domain